MTPLLQRGPVLQHTTFQRKRKIAIDMEPNFFVTPTYLSHGQKDVIPGPIKEKIRRVPPGLQSTEPDTSPERGLKRPQSTKATPSSQAASLCRYASLTRGRALGLEVKLGVSRAQGGIGRAQASEPRRLAEARRPRVGRRSGQRNSVFGFLWSTSR